MKRFIVELILYFIFFISYLVLSLELYKNIPNVFHSLLNHVDGYIKNKELTATLLIVGVACILYYITIIIIDAIVKAIFKD